MSPYTLPLFDQLFEPSFGEGPSFEEGASFEAGIEQVLSLRPGLVRARRRKRLSEGEKHLAAARRISKGMWRLPDHSPEQTQAGQEICRHLLASLADWSDPAP